MRRQRLTLSLLAACMAALPVRAQTSVTAPISWNAHTIDSSVLQAERQYLVSLPPSYEQSGARYPVLTILDADDAAQFTAALANIRFLSDRGEVPQLIVVGITNGRDRAHDMTPPTTAADEVEQLPTAGGADDFLRYISEEVLPAVRADYRATATTVLAGHSFGGLFALHTAASSPGLFVGAIAMSPSLQWNNAGYVTTFSDRLARASAYTRLFVTSGGLEPPIDVNAQRFAARMDSFPNRHIAFRYARYPDDTHGMTPLPSLVDGLRFVFEPISTRTATGDLIALRQDATSEEILAVSAAFAKRYATGAHLLGLSDTLPENVLNEHGYVALEYFRNPAAAVVLFERNAALYPESANVHDSLGDGLLAVGDTTAARVAFSKAVELAKATNHPVQSVSARKLEALTKPRD